MLPEVKFAVLEIFTKVESGSEKCGSDNYVTRRQPRFALMKVYSLQGKLK